MNSRRARRAALRFWGSAAILTALSLVPLAPAFAWSPPPRPLPTQPADTDGQDPDLHDERPGLPPDTWVSPCGQERLQDTDLQSAYQPPMKCGAWMTVAWRLFTDFLHLGYGERGN